MIGTEFSHYRVEEKIGAGGMGVVYRGWDTLVGRPVALKVLRPDLADDPDEARRHLLREARAAMSVVHENVCPVYGVLELPDGELCIAMGYCEGRSLEVRLREGRPTTIEAMELSKQIVAGLAAAHAAGVVHRDVTPRNVIVSPQGSARLLDFGLARHAGTLRQRGAATIAGTPQYMAPEVLAGELPGTRSDVYSLGIVLWRVWTGAHPSTPGTDGHALPPGLDAVLRRMLAPDPTRRPASAREVERELAIVWRGIVESAEEPTQPLDGRSRRRGAPGRALVLRWIWVPFVVAGIVSFLVRDRSPTPVTPRLGIAVVAPHEGTGSLVAEGLATALVHELVDTARRTGAFWVVPHEWNDEVGAWTAREARSVLGVDVVVGIEPTATEGVVVELYTDGAKRSHRFERVPAPETVLGVLADWELAPPDVARNATPWSLDAYRGLAHLRRGTASGDSAVTLLRNASGRGNDARLVHALAAALVARYESKGDAADAERAAASLDSLIAAERVPVRARVSRARLALRRGDAGTAEALLARAHGMAPADFQVLRHLAWAYEVLGEFALAEDVRVSTVAALPDFVGSHERMGLFRLAHGLYREAWSSFARAHELAPGYAYTFNLLGASSVQLGCWEQAVEYFERALQAGQSADATANLAFLYYHLGEFGQAVQMYRWAVADSPDDHELLGALAVSLWWTGQRDEAREWFDRAIARAESELESAADPGPIWLGLAGYCVFVDRDRAREALDRAVALLPRDAADGHLAAAAVHAALDDVEPALQHLRRAVALGIPARRIEGSPFLRSLRENPGYRHLLAEAEAPGPPCPELPSSPDTAPSNDERTR